MSSDVREILKKEMMMAPWSDLKEHAERDAVFLLAPELDMLEVAYALVKNDVVSVTGWLKTQSLSRPTAQQMQSWRSEASKTFRFVIVQPHVLIQDVSH